MQSDHLLHVQRALGSCPSAHDCLGYLQRLRHVPGIDAVLELFVERN